MKNSGSNKLNTYIINLQSDISKKEKITKLLQKTRSRVPHSNDDLKRAYLFLLSNFVGEIRHLMRISRKLRRYLKTGEFKFYPQTLDDLGSQ